MAQPGQWPHLCICSWLTWGTCNLETSLSVSEFSQSGSSDHSVSWPRKERVQHMEHSLSGTGTFGFLIVTCMGALAWCWQECCHQKG